MAEPERIGRILNGLPDLQEGGFRRFELGLAVVALALADEMGRRRALEQRIDKLEASIGRLRRRGRGRS